MTHCFASITVAISRRHFLFFQQSPARKKARLLSPEATDADMKIADSGLGDVRTVSEGSSVDEGSIDGTKNGDFATGGEVQSKAGGKVKPKAGHYVEAGPGRD